MRIIAVALFVAACQAVIPDCLAAEPTAPPTCTTHFFDWYTVNPKAPLESQQKRWTYQVQWDTLGIKPEEIGNSVHYYEVQFRKIRAAGFDGLHYEWHRNNPKPQFLEALKKTGLPVAMFYDMEIRFGSRPRFMTPTADFARTFVDDVLSFYHAVPCELWLHDRHGRLPVVVYGYAFDTAITNPQAWEQFYRTIIDGVEKGLGQQLVFHWTNNGSPQQLYGFQHFPQIQSYTFNEASQQSQVNAHSVTFVVHYDDLGVSFARQGDRKTRWIRNDIRYLQEDLWLAEHTDPDLVFNYGWNELFEGEHLLPDSLWGSWRYELAAAMVKHIKVHAKADLPRVLVIVDDFLPALYAADPARTAILRREMGLLAQLRSVVPQAEVVLPGQRRKLADYAAIFSLNTVKTADEEAALAACGRKIVYVNPSLTADTPVTRRITNRPRSQVCERAAELANEYVVAGRKIDVDFQRFPFLQYRCRNSPGSVFHLRYYGLNQAGKQVQAWYETSPTDDQHTGGQWVARQVDLAQLARQGAGEPVVRLTRIEFILDDLDENGTFTLDVDYLRIVDAKGGVGWSDEFQSVSPWEVHANFERLPGSRARFSFKAVEEEKQTIGRMTLQAVVSDKDIAPVDESTQHIVPVAAARVLTDAAFQGAKIPILLARDQVYWLNTYRPSDACWEILIAELLGRKAHRGVVFRSFSHTILAEGVKAASNEAPMTIEDAPLPIERVRLVAPPEFQQPMSHVLPVGWQQMLLRVVHGRRGAIPLPDPGSNPSSVTLEPGEVVDLTRQR